MNVRRAVRALLVLLLALPTPAAATASASAASTGRVTLTVLSPVAIADVSGAHEGSVEALAVRDQEGIADDPARYVSLLGQGAGYSGYRTYELPASVAPSRVTTIALTANVRGPIAAANPWTWSLFDWSHDAWVRLGNQNHCGGDAGTRKWPCDDLDPRPWKYVRDNLIVGADSTPADFVGPGGELRVRLSARSPGSAELDWEALEVYSNAGGTGPRWTPPLRTRWQWQLQGAPGRHEATGGINVHVCRPTFRGGPCVRPEVFDVDLFVDPSIAGRFGYVVDTAAVAAIHASGRHVIGYVTAGDAERWRPDYEQFVDFDRRCHGCLLGKPFSHRFPDEYWANINRGRGRFDFMLQMLRARTDRVAAAGFDGIEYDIVDAYAQGRRVTGWRITYDTQLAYNLALAQMAHEDGLAVALKNDGGQIPDLVSSFDFAINEQCFQYHECDGGGYPAPGWRAFVEAGKPVFEAEYRLEPSAFCPTANEWGFDSIKKARDFNLYGAPWTPCR